MNLQQKKTTVYQVSKVHSQMDGDRLMGGGGGLQHGPRLNVKGFPHCLQIAGMEKGPGEGEIRISFRYNGLMLYGPV